MRLVRVALAGMVGAGVLVVPFAVLLGSSNENDGFKRLLGKSQDELVRQGAIEYPEEGRGHNHACHRLAARIAADKYGSLASLGGGVMNEIAESLSLALMGQNPLSGRNVSETLGDLRANWRGVRDSLRTARR